jgi:hypothetical protein
LQPIELDPNLSALAIEEARARYPQFAPYQVRLIGRPLFQGMGYQLEWKSPPPAELPDAWEFQNAAVKAYKRLAGSD